MRHVDQGNFEVFLDENVKIGPFRDSSLERLQLRSNAVFITDKSVSLDDVLGQKVYGNLTILTYEELGGVSGQGRLLPLLKAEARTEKGEILYLATWTQEHVNVLTSSRKVYVGEFMVKKESGIYGLRYSVNLSKYAYLQPVGQDDEEEDTEIVDLDTGDFDLETYC